jgi:hypothetical protein
VRLYFSQDLPLTYKFGFTKSSVEVSLQADASVVQQLDDVVLPAGESGNNSLAIFVYVSDKFGSSTRCSVGPDQVSPVSVVSTPAVIDDITLFVHNSTLSLQDAVASGKVGNVLTTINGLSQLLGGPCGSSPCGSFGVCDATTGACNCTAGYTGAFCQIAPTPTFSEWTEIGACSVACGGGFQMRTRTCSVGLQCVGDYISSTGCNSQDCEGPAVNGGFSQWSEWSACSSSCPGDTSGDFSGIQTRSRACDNPLPSDDGEPCMGNFTETKPCNVEPCVSWLKRCPGSSGDVLAETLLPSIECSGNGECLRTPDNCRQDEQCTAVCSCNDGFGGSDCSKSSAAVAEAQQLRSSLLKVLVGDPFLDDC